MHVRDRAVALSGPGEGVVLSGCDTKVYLKLALGSISGPYWGYASDLVRASGQSEKGGE